MTMMGQPGWFSLPRHWYTRPYPGGSCQLLASPNANFEPSYCCVLGDDGMTYVFQDLLREKILGISS